MELGRWLAWDKDKSSQMSCNDFFELDDDSTCILKNSTAQRTKSLSS